MGNKGWDRNDNNRAPMWLCGKPIKPAGLKLCVFSVNFHDILYDFKFHCSSLLTFTCVALLATLVLFEKPSGATFLVFHVFLWLVNYSNSLLSSLCFLSYLLVLIRLPLILARTLSCTQTHILYKIPSSLWDRGPSGLCEVFWMWMPCRLVFY